MADQKRWFKLWCSAPADDDLQALPPALRWAWVALGAYTKEHGTNGIVKISASNAALAAQMGVAVEELNSSILRLPHLTVKESANSNGEFTVTWDNWTKYQEDSTVARRQKEFRARNRNGSDFDTVKNTAFKKPENRNAESPVTFDDDGKSQSYQIVEGGKYALQGSPRNGLRREEKRREYILEIEKSPVAKEISPEAMRVANLLAESITKNFPSRTNWSDAQIRKWAEEADRLNHLDRHSWEEITDVLVWTQSDQFWKSIVLSIKSLRRNWNSIISKRPQKKPIGGKFVGQ